MSRIGKSPVAIAEGVTVVIENNSVTVKGKLGELSQELSPNITVKEEEGNLILERGSESKTDRAQHGLMRALLNNMIEGVSKGFTKELELVGRNRASQTYD